MGGTRELPCATWQACPILLQCFLQSLWAAIRPPSPSLSGLSNYDQFLSPIIVQALRRDSQAPCRDATDRRGCLSRGRRSTQSLLEEAQYTTYQTSHSSLLTYHCHHSCQASLTAPLLTPHLSHLTHHFSLTIVMDHSLSCQASLTAPLLTTSRGRRSTQSLLEELRRAWSPLGPRLPFYGARGRRWGPGCLSRCRRSTQSLLEELRRPWSPLGPRLPLAWQAQYTEPPGGAAARVVAAEAAAAFHVAGTQSLLEELRGAWSPLHGAAVAFRVAGAVHRASWRSCGARGRRWGRGCLSRGRRSTPLITCHSSLLTYHCHHSCQASLTAPLLTPHLSHLTHHFSLTIVMDHSLSCQASLTAPLLTISRGRRSTQSLLEELRRAWSPLGPRLPFAWQAQYTPLITCHSSLLTCHCHHSCQASLTAPLLTPHLSHLTHHFSLTIVTTHVKHHSPLHFSPSRVAGAVTEPPGVVAAGAAAAFRVAGAVHRASWRSCGARGRRWGRGCLSAARVVAAGAAAAFRVAGAVHRVSWRSCGARGRRWGRGCLSRGRRSTPLIACHSSLLTYHCHHSCQASLTAPLLTPHLSHLTHHFSLTIVTTHVKHHSPLHFSPSRVAGAVHRASWRSCGARGRRWGRGCLSHGGRSIRSCGARGRRWSRGCLSCSRRSTQSLLEELRRALRRAWSPLGPRLPFPWQAQHTEPPGGAAARVVAAGAAAAFRVAGAVHRASWRSCGARGRCWGRGCLSRGRRSTRRSTQLLITTHHNLSHPNSSQLHFSHLTYHIRTHHSSTSHTSHHKPTSHTSLLTPPRSSH